MIIRRGDKKRKQNRKINRERPSFGLILKKIFFWLIFLSFWILTFWTIFYSEVMTVENIEIESSIAEKSEIEQLIRRSISGTYLSVIPKDNLLLVSKKNIRDMIQNEFIFVRRVEMTRSFPKTIKVSIEERESHIIWCSSRKCHLVDERAEAFYEIKEKEVFEAPVIRVEDQSGKEVFLGSRVAKPNFVEFCEHMPEKITSISGIAVGSELSTPSSMSNEVRVVASDGWSLLLSTERSAETQGEILKKIMNEKIDADKIDEIEYVDLRIKGKATFKFKSDEENDKNKEGNEDDL